ncbi:hypothetical protein [Stigmatella aurantiaca]|uniref:Conserved uncharacterized protein n=1 Tax=Stigmatella aurantiaca (strain DW4/3-1) TaxID=378806 RepID=Q08Y77_STIAD|nr:hypothetical protein [Stigmatella aurantiaca]ADO67949.1 conserved uncharacterized protein [Stigmatella aurantiaca DW4/3-1]EAU65432.1 conserved hypothetical protein [Stigmatella aurantiaca DW4/3-1]
MASMQHEGLLLLFRHRPTLAPELLRDALGFSLPPWSEARVESAELTEVVPTEYRADLVVLLLEGKPVFAMVVEVQLARDEDKRKTWPLSLTSLRSRVGCPTALLVVAPDASVARWCAQPIELGHPGFILRPLVAGPDAIPVLTDEQAARRDPELAVLSAMAHGHAEVGPAIAHTVLAAVEGLDAERIRLYVDLTLSSLNEAARHALEALMQSGHYEYQSEFARKYVAQGREEGREKGREEGREEGLQEGERTALLEVLDARGFSVEEGVRQHILACTDLPQLKRWLRKAVTVQSVQELFTPEAPPKPSVRKAGKPGRRTKTQKARPQR